MQRDDVYQQYKTTDLLHTRQETHRLYSEQPLDLDAQCSAMLDLTGEEALLDVGCGPGLFLRHLSANGHHGRLVGLDQSPAMITKAKQSAAGSGSGSDPSSGHGIAPGPDPGTSSGPAIEWHEGVADALPFTDREFAVLSARHMLYHVPDIPAALREFARVVGAGGVVLVATNGPRNTPGLADLEEAVAREFDLNESLDSSRRFHTSIAPAMLRAVFPVVEEKSLPGALVFTDPTPIVDYVMTQSVPQQAAADPELFPRIHAWVTAQATARLDARGGVWRDPKTVGLYRCIAG